MSFTILPTPRECELGPESVTLDRQSPVTADAGVPSDLVDRVSGLLPEGAGSVPVRLVTGADFGAEEYELTVTAGEAGIRVTASERAGFVHAIERLGQITRTGRVPIMVAPAGGSNQSTCRQLPDFPRYADNIAAFCQRAHEANAMGVLTTSWYDFPIDAVVPAIMYTGQASWNVDTCRGLGGMAGT